MAQYGGTPTSVAQVQLGSTSYVNGQTASISGNCGQAYSLSETGAGQWGSGTVYFFQQWEVWPSGGVANSFSISTTYYAWGSTTIALIVWAGGPLPTQSTYQGSTGGYVEYAPSFTSTSVTFTLPTTVRYLTPVIGSYDGTTDFDLLYVFAGMGGVYGVPQFQAGVAIYVLASSIMICPYYMYQHPPSGFPQVYYFALSSNCGGPNSMPAPHLGDIIHVGITVANSATSFTIADQSTGSSFSATSSFVPDQVTVEWGLQSGLCGGLGGQLYAYGPNDWLQMNFQSLSAGGWSWNCEPFPEFSQIQFTPTSSAYANLAASTLSEIQFSQGVIVNGLTTSQDWVNTADLQSVNGFNVMSCVSAIGCPAL